MKPTGFTAALTASSIFLSLAAPMTQPLLAAPPATTAIAPAAAPRAGAAATHWAVELPLTACEGLVCFAVTGDDGKPQTWMLDTGDIHSFVASDIAQRSRWAMTPLTGADGKEIAGISKTGPARLHLGALTLETKLLVFDRARMAAVKAPYDGGLAFTDLADRVVQLDLPHHRLRISDVAAATTAATAAATPHRLGTLHRITFGKRGPAILTGGPFMVNGRTVEAQVDSGYTGNMLIYDAAIAPLGLAAAAKAAAGHGRSFPFTDGGVTMLEGAAGSVGFAGHVLDAAAPALFFPTPGVHQPDGLFEATVGTAFFRSSVLTLDLHSMTFDVQPVGGGA